MDIERLLDKFGPNWSPPHTLSPEERESLKEEIEPIWRGYNNLPLTLDIEDEGVRRVCEVLTLSGFRTYSSCNGHGKKLPHMYFYSEKNELVARLAHIIQKTAITNFQWGIQVFGFSGLSDMRLNYDLKPFSLINDQGAYSKDLLFEDFDILGFTFFGEFLNKKWLCTNISLNIVQGTFQSTN